MWWRARGRSSGVAKGVGRKRRPKVELHTKREVDNFCCSHRCTSNVHFGQGRAGASNTSASRYFRSSCLPCRALRRGFLLYCSALYCFSFAKASSVQYRICEPAIFCVTGSGTTRFSIHRCKVARWIPRSLAASEIEYWAIFNMRHGVAYCQVNFLV